MLSELSCSFHTRGFILTTYRYVVTLAHELCASGVDTTGPHAHRYVPVNAKQLTPFLQGVGGWVQTTLRRLGPQQLTLLCCSRPSKGCGSMTSASVYDVLT
jgi:hypothetical protein